MKLEKERYEALLKYYSVTYPKSMWLFKNPPSFKFWNWLFTQYVYQSKMKRKYPDPCLMNIPRVYLEGYLGLSRSTIKNCIAHMIAVGVITKKRNSESYVFNAGYILGVIAMVNSEPEDKISDIEALFSAGDKNGLIRMGLIELSDFDIPTVSALEPHGAQNTTHLRDEGQNITYTEDEGYNKTPSPELGHNITLVDDKGHNITPNMQNEVYYNLFAIFSDERGLYFTPTRGSEYNPDGQNIANLLDEIDENWSGEVRLSIKKGNLTGVSTFVDDDGNLRGENRVIIKPQVGYNKTFMGYNKTFKGHNITPIYNSNNSIKTDYSPVIEKELKEIKETLRLIPDLKVLLEKNQNSSLEPVGSSSSQNFNSLEGNVEEYDETPSAAEYERLRQIEREKFFRTEAGRALSRALKDTYPHNTPAERKEVEAELDSLRAEYFSETGYNEKDEEIEIPITETKYYQNQLSEEEIEAIEDENERRNVRDQQNMCDWYEQSKELDFVFGRALTSYGYITCLYLDEVDKTEEEELEEFAEKVKEARDAGRYFSESQYEANLDSREHTLYNKVEREFKENEVFDFEYVRTAIMEWAIELDIFKFGDTKYYHPSLMNNINGCK